MRSTDDTNVAGYLTLEMRTAQKAPKWQTPQASAMGASTQANDRPAGHRRDAVSERPARRRLSSNAVNFLVDACLFVTFIALLTVQAIVQFVFPAAANAAGHRLWGMDYAGWIRVATGALGVFALLVLLHLILHWNWVCMFVTSRLSKWLDRRVVIGEAVRTIYGVALLIAVLTFMGIVVTAAEFQISPPR